MNSVFDKMSNEPLKMTHEEFFNITKAVVSPGQGLILTWHNDQIVKSVAERSGVLEELSIWIESKKGLCGCFVTVLEYIDGDIIVFQYYHGHDKPMDNGWVLWFISAKMIELLPFELARKIKAASTFGSN